MMVQLFKHVINTKSVVLSPGLPIATNHARFHGDEALYSTFPDFLPPAEDPYKFRLINTVFPVSHPEFILYPGSENSYFIYFAK